MIHRPQPGQPTSIVAELVDEDLGNWKDWKPRCLLAGDLIVNEIMYHPITGKAIDEWIEFHNPGDQSVNLDGFRIVEGVDFSFPQVELGAGEYLVVAADTAAFTARYPDVTNVIGGWEGRLSNRSEDIVN